MEIFLLVVVMIFLVIIMTKNSRTKSLVEDLSDISTKQTFVIKELVKEVRALRDEVAAQPRTAVTVTPEQTVEKPAAKEEVKPGPIPEVKAQPIPGIKAEPEPEPELEPVPEEMVEEAWHSGFTVVEETYTPPSATRAETEQRAAPQPEPQFEESWMDKWFRNNPDLEKFIGENLLNKIGIAVFVLGIGFFVKYAIDKEWINEVGRVAIGILCGAGLVGIAHYLHKSYRSFSSVLAGGGLAVFYFTIAFAFHQYHLMSQTSAFVVMVVITGFAVALAILYDRIELAVIAAVGGFITPFLLSTGEGNYIVLFTYLIILDLGLLALAYFKRWPLLNILSLFFTIIIYSGWMTKTMMANELTFPYQTALLFATMFYLIFLCMNMINQVRNKQPFKAFDFSILLLITFTYYSAGMVQLDHISGGQYQGLFTVVMGAINFALAYYFYKRTETDRNLLYLLIGLTLTFISLAAPVQLHGHTITMFWMAEFVLLYWLSQRSGIQLFKYSSLIVCVLAAVSLIIDWEQAAQASTYSLAVIFINAQGIVTNVIAIGAFTAFYLLSRKQESEFIPSLSSKFISSVSLVIALGLLYLTAIMSINLVFGKQTSYMEANVYHRLLTLVISIAVISWLGRKEDKQALLYVLPGLTALNFIYSIFSAGMVADLRNSVLMHNGGATHLAIHFLDQALLLFMIFTAIKKLRTEPLFANFKDGAAWALSLSTVILLSIECLNIYTLIGYHDGNIPVLESNYTKAGLTILWSSSSFVMIWLGIKHRYKTLRVISLSLFSLTLLKLFLFDIRHISEGSKIAAFVLLGLLLLAASFMYQKLKKIIFEDGKEG